MDEQHQSEPVYSDLVVRFKAIFADSVVIVVVMMMASYVFSSFKNVPDLLRVMVFIFIVVLYEPLLVSLLGGTLGHMMNGIKVKRESDHTKNISFPLALFRFGIKVLLGWISLLTVTGNKKCKAIHDYAAGSVVINQN